MNKMQFTNCPFEFPVCYEMKTAGKGDITGLIPGLIKIL
jgi:hypothetical protein